MDQNVILLIVLGALAAVECATTGQPVSNAPPSLGVGDPTLLGENPQAADRPSLRPETSPEPSPTPSTEPSPTPSPELQSTNGRHSHENCVQRWRDFEFCLHASSYESSDRAGIFCRDCWREFLQMAGACLPQSQSLLSEIRSARLFCRSGKSSEAVLHLQCFPQVAELINCQLLSPEFNVIGSPGNVKLFCEDCRSGVEVDASVCQVDAAANDFEFLDGFCQLFSHG